MVQWLCDCCVVLCFYVHVTKVHNFIFLLGRQEGKEVSRRNKVRI